MSATARSGFPRGQHTGHRGTPLPASGRPCPQTHPDGRLQAGERGNGTTPPYRPRTEVAGGSTSAGPRGAAGIGQLGSRERVNREWLPWTLEGRPPVGPGDDPDRGNALVGTVGGGRVLLPRSTRLFSSQLAMNAIAGFAGGGSLGERASARAVSRDCASQGRRPHGSRPARSCLCSPWRPPEGESLLRLVRYGCH
jgi:hypothetical protein